MAFEVYSARAGHSTRNTDPNTVSIAVSGKKTKNLSIVLGIEVMKEFDLKITDNVDIYFGTGEDKGMVLVQKVKRGIVIAKYSNKKKDEETIPGLISRLIKPIAPIADFRNENIARVVVNHQKDVASGGLILELPPDFFTE